MSPVAILDKGVNLRSNYDSPHVVFPTNAVPSVDRMWILYRKTDPGTTVNAPAGLYYKAMRLLVRLPLPVQLTAQQIASVNVAGNTGPYEVDWLRNRIYFTEIDEGREITVNYLSTSGQISGLRYRVGWGDEISAGSGSGDPTTAETFMLTGPSINEGQVNAFRDIFTDKLWVFWSSTRTGSADLFYQTLAPQFYPLSTIQQ